MCFIMSKSEPLSAEESSCGSLKKKYHFTSSGFCVCNRDVTSIWVHCLTSGSPVYGSIKHSEVPYVKRYRISF